jgi:regulator of replication initiation timing
MTERVARPGNDDSHAALQEELVTLTASHQTLVAQLTTIADEMHEIKADNARLQEENEAWQLLIEDRTLAGAMRGGLLSPSKDDSMRGSSPISAGSIRCTDPSVLGTLEEQMEMDELNHEMDAQSYFDEDPLPRHTSPTKANGMSLALEISAAPQMAETEALRTEVKSLKEANRALSLYCSKVGCHVGRF